MTMKKRFTIDPHQTITRARERLDALEQVTPASDDEAVTLQSDCFDLKMRCETAACALEVWALREDEPAQARRYWELADEAKDLAERLMETWERLNEWQRAQRPQPAFKVLVATRAGQGMDDGDECGCAEGELVMFGPECGQDGCRCQQVMMGAVGAEPTTTMRVAWYNGSRDELVTELRLGLDNLEVTQRIGAERADQVADVMSEMLIAHAEDFPVGTVVERDGNVFRERQTAPVLAA